MQENNLSKAILTHIGTANPPHKLSQLDAADFMVSALNLEPAKERILRSVYKATAIDQRFTVLEDYAKKKDWQFFSPGLDPFPSTSKRMEVFKENAVPLAMAAVADAGIDQDELKDVTHLITVSCTGLYAPGLDIDLVDALGLSTRVERVAIQFMGCYAAFNALKVARSTVQADPKAKVLIVLVEMCTLHFQKEWSQENLIVNALFADGAAAVLVQSEVEIGRNALSLDGFRCELATEGKKAMSWDLSETGFAMGLSASVPAILKAQSGKVIGAFLKDFGSSFEAINNWAIHPGGKKILAEVEEALNLPESANEASYSVLREFGNMSSATIFFVIKAQLQTNPKGPMLAMAFGPGLTLEMGLFTPTNV